MNSGPLVIGILGLLGWLTLRYLSRRGLIDTGADRVRRGTGHAMLGLEEFIAPSVEYVLEAENAEHRIADDREAGDGDAIERELAATLVLSPVDPEEIRRHLATASRAGLNWREVYEEAVRAELRARPYRAPAMLPASRVQPRE